MNEVDVKLARSAEAAIPVNKVLKNTYLLLSMTLAFSAFAAYLSFNAPPLSPWIFLVGAYGFLFATHALANSSWGLLTTFGISLYIWINIENLDEYVIIWNIIAAQKEQCFF